MSKKPAAQPQDKYVLRLPDGLRDKLKAEAELNNRSINAEILDRIEGVENDLTHRDMLRRVLDQNAYLLEDSKNSLAHVQEMLAELRLMRHLLDRCYAERDRLSEGLVEILGMLGSRQRVDEHKVGVESSTTAELLERALAAAEVSEKSDADLARRPPWKSL